MAQLLLQVEGEASPLDFYDETKYFLNHTSALPPTPVFERHTAPRRGADGELLVSSTQIATELRFEVRCRGATYQEALGNLSEILTRLGKAEAYAKPARTGSPVRFIRQLGDQLEPQVYEVEFGDFFRKDEALESVNYISGELYLRCSPIPHALTATEVCNLGMCNYDHWVIDVGGSEPVQARISVTPHGDAAHYDFIRVAALDSRTRDVNNFLWPMYLGLNTPPTGYAVALGGAGRVGGVRVHVLAKGTGQYQLRWRTAGGDAFNAAGVTTLTDGAAYQEQIHEVSTNPSTELPWTEADLNGGQWGVQKVGATEVRITQLYLAPLYVERDQLTEVITTRLADGAGAADTWSKTGAATAWDAVNDAVGANDGDTTYISSTTDTQETFLTFQDYAGPTGLDVGVRATVQGTGGFVNGALEEPYSGPTFGATLVNDPIADLTGWTLQLRGTVTGMVYNGTHSALQINPDISGNPNGQGFASRSYGGLTPGVPVRLQLDLRTLTGAPLGSGCWVAIQDGSNMKAALRQHTTSFTTVYVDFVPMSEQVLLYLGVEGIFSSTLYKNLLIREVASYADGWGAVGTAAGHQEVPQVGWYPQSVTARQVDGDSSQGVGEGDTNNYVGQVVSAIDGDTYRIVANIQARGYDPSTYQDAPPFSFEVESGANQEVVTSTNSLDFDRVEITQVADGDTMTLKAYGSAGAGGFLDGVVVQHLAEESDAGAVALRVTIDENVVDHYGTYQLWARMKASGGPIGVIVRSGGDDGQLVASGMVTVEESDGVRTGRIGAVVIPATPTDPSAPITSFTFSVIVEPVSTSSDPVHLDIDCLELWPAGNYQVARNGEGRGPAPDEVQVFDPASGTVYVANGAGNTLRTTASVEGSSITLYPGENLVLVRVSRSETDDQLCPEDPFDVCLRYTEAGILSEVPNAPAPSGLLVASGSYTGNGVDGRAITGAGFEPKVVFVWRSGTVFSHVVRTSAHVGDAAKYFDGSGPTIDNEIQSLDADGFTVGGGGFNSTNLAANAYEWLALGDEASGDLAVFSYVGNGVDDRALTDPGFAPALLFVLPHSGDEPILRTADMPSGDSHQWNGATLTTAIKTFTATGCTLGTHSGVNGSGATYYAVALRASERLEAFSYVGDGTDDRQVGGRSFAPAAAWLLDGTTANGCAWRTSTMAAGFSVATNGFSSGGNTNTNQLQALTSDGVEVGSNVRVNASAHTYYGIALRGA